MRWGDIFFKTPGSVGLGTEIKWWKCLPLPPPRRAVHNSRATSNKVCIGGGRGRSLFVCFAHHILMLNTTRVMATYFGDGWINKGSYAATITRCGVIIWMGWLWGEGEEMRRFIYQATLVWNAWIMSHQWDLLGCAILSLNNANCVDFDTHVPQSLKHTQSYWIY